MPVEESTDIDVAGNIKTLDDLDKAAQKVIKTLEKETKQVEKSTNTIKKTKKKKEKESTKEKTSTETEKITNDIKKQIFGEELSQNTVKNIVSGGKDPVGFATNILKSIPFIGGVVAFADFARSIIDEIAKLDAFFKAFVDRVDTRHNQLRNKEQQARIQAGEIQLILPTEQGGLEIREPFNTFNEFNNNRIAFENENAIRSTSDF